MRDFTGDSTQCGDTTTTATELAAQAERVLLTGGLPPLLAQVQLARDALGANAWAERARRELRAAGERSTQPAPRAPDLLARRGRGPLRRHRRLVQAGRRPCTHRSRSNCWPSGSAPRGAWPPRT